MKAGQGSNNLFASANGKYFAQQWGWDADAIIHCETDLCAPTTSSALIS